MEVKRQNINPKLELRLYDPRRDQDCSKGLTMTPYPQPKISDNPGPSSQLAAKERMRRSGVVT